jgi:hypothetical protein
MGRPLHKKYFGNRNTGSTSTEADNGIGGQGIASISFSNQGNFAGNGLVNPLVGLALPAPTIPGGVQATGTITYEVSTVTTGAGSVGLVVGDTYTFAGTGNAVFTVATSTNNATNATFTVTNRGTGIASVPTDTITVSATRLSGTGAATFTVDVFFRVKSFAIVEQGSGYTGAETITVTLNTGATGTVPVCTDVLTVDTGGVPGSTTNQENAITMTGRVVAGATVALDVIKQTGARRYLVTDGTNTGVVELVGDAVDAAGEANIIATDSASGTYYVTKITAHRALVVPGTGTQFPLVNGSAQSIPWELDTAVLNTSVRVANA